MTSKPGTTPSLPRVGLLVERDEVLRTLGSLLEFAAGGSGHTVLVAGEAGIGKTSVLRALAATHAHVRLWWGACDALQTPNPLGPLYDIARTSDVRFATYLRADGNRARRRSVREPETRRSTISAKQSGRGDSHQRDALGHFLMASAAIASSRPRSTAWKACSPLAASNPSEITRTTKRPPTRPMNSA